MKNTLEVDSVILEFGNKRVLQDVYVKLETGKVIGFLGRNGTGKSCLMKVIYGLLDIVDKSVRINDQTIYSTYRNPSIMRYLPQHEFIPKKMLVDRIFRDFEIDFNIFTRYYPSFSKYKKSAIRYLSAGERRIVEIYCILASETKFVMLDEPFSQVMPVHVETLKEIILKEKKNKGILITDHLYEHVLGLCDDIYVISNGKTHRIKSKAEIIQLGYLKADSITPNL